MLVITTYKEPAVINKCGLLLLLSIIGQEKSLLQATCPSMQPVNLIILPLKRSNAILIHHIALLQQ